MFETISETVAAYDECIRECTDDIVIFGLTFDPADALNRLDPIAYKCGWIDWCDSEGIDTDELEDDYTFNRDRM